MFESVWNFQGEWASLPLESNDVGGTPTLLEEKKVRTKVPQPSPAIQPPMVEVPEVTRSRIGAQRVS